MNVNVVCPAFAEFGQCAVAKGLIAGHLVITTSTGKEEEKGLDGNVPTNLRVS